MSDVLNAIEDLHSGVPYNPAAWRTDGRLYPPLADMANDSLLPGVTLYRNFAHVTLISENGAIAIVEFESRKVLLIKPGADGAGFAPLEAF